MKIRELATEPVGHLLWRYSLPSIVGMLVMSLYNVVDRVILGQVVGKEAIAGLTVTFPLMNLATAIGVLVGVGACSRVSILLGAGNADGARRVLGNALTLTLANAVVYLTLMAVYLDDLLLLFGASEVSLPYARDFMQWILPGLLLMNLGFGFNNIMRASGYPVKSMVTMMIGAGCNVVLAPITVYVLDMGIKGAAIATDISMAITSAWVMLHFCRRSSTLHFGRGIYALRWSTVKSIFAIGASPALINAASCFINVIINHALYRHGGDNAIATAGIFVTVTSLVVTLVIGVNMGMQPILGYNFGAGLYGRLRRVFILATLWATVACTLGFLAGTFFPGAIARAFTSDAELIAITASALPLAMRAFAIVGFQIVATGMFQSIGSAGKAIFLSLTRQVLFLIPLLLTLPGIYGLDGVWASFPVSDLMATVVTALMVWWQFRIFSRAVTHSA